MYQIRFPVNGGLCIAMHIFDIGAIEAFHIYVVVSSKFFLQLPSMNTFNKRIPKYDCRAFLSFGLAFSPKLRFLIVAFGIFIFIQDFAS